MPRYGTDRYFFLFMGPSDIFGQMLMSYNSLVCWHTTLYWLLSHIMSFFSAHLVRISIHSCKTSHILKCRNTSSAVSEKLVSPTLSVIILTASSATPNFWISLINITKRMEESVEPWVKPSLCVYLVSSTSPFSTYIDCRHVVIILVSDDHRSSITIYRFTLSYATFLCVQIFYLLSSSGHHLVHIYQLESFR